MITDDLTDEEYGEFKEAARQDGPCPTEYRDDDGDVDFDAFEEDYKEWDEDTGFSKW